MITANQLVAHLVGDYVLQSDYMAREKTNSRLVAASHAVWYAIPFILLDPSIWAYLVIVVTHFFIDHYRLAKYMVYAKEWALTPPRHRYPWAEAGPHGYHEDKPDYLAYWLMFIADNVLHILINGAALKWL